MRRAVLHTLLHTRGDGQVTCWVKVHRMKMLPNIRNKVSGRHPGYLQRSIHLLSA